jgi:hypothetical protein
MQKETKTTEDFDAAFVNTERTTEQNVPNILELVVQLDSLQKRLTPHLPALSQKLVKDLLSTGVDAKRLAKVVGRSPSYVRAVGGGVKSLGADGIVKVVKYAVSEQRNVAG